jgi:hypothetical protein
MKFTVFNRSETAVKKKNPQHGRQRAVGSGEGRRNVSSLFDVQIKYDVFVFFLLTVFQ